MSDKVSEIAAVSQLSSDSLSAEYDELRKDGTQVEGLYAAGCNTSGLPCSGAAYSSGFSIGDATFFGRIAGQCAAANY